MRIGGAERDKQEIGFSDANRLTMEPLNSREGYPMSEAMQAFRAALSQSVPRAITVSCPYVIARGEGSYLYTTDGTRLIDFMTGIAVMNVGHAHPKVTAAIQKAAENGTHFCFQVMGYEPYVRLAERLIAQMPETDASGQSLHWKAAFFNSGAEAVENAMKVARTATKRTTFLAFEHGFHGRTFGAMSLTSKAMPYRAGFGPFVPEVLHLPYPTRYRCGGCATGCDCTRTTIAHIEQLFATQLPASEVAAIFIEPVVGEGGFYIPPDDFLPALRQLCTQQGILLVVDEIQTGIGRTGAFYRFQTLNVAPDMVLTAKALGGGLPLSGLLGRAEVLDAVHSGGIGGTYGGNPIACAAAHAVLDILEEENLCAEARRKGALVMERLEAWKTEFPFIGDVRGVGLMCALEFVKEGTEKEPYKEIVSRLIARCYENGLALLPAGTYGNCLRLLPALTIPDDTLAEGLSVLEAALRAEAAASV